MPTLKIGGRSVQVGEDFLKLSPENQQLTVESIAESLALTAPPKDQPQSLFQVIEGLLKAFRQRLRALTT